MKANAPSLDAASHEQICRVYCHINEDGWTIGEVVAGEVPELPGCMSRGRTLDEMLDKMREVMASRLAHQDLEMPVLVPISRVWLECLEVKREILARLNTGFAELNTGFAELLSDIAAWRAEAQGWRATFEARRADRTRDN